MQCWHDSRLHRTDRQPAAGLFGIGGGMIMGPLLLEFGLHPMVSSSPLTSA